MSLTASKDKFFHVADEGPDSSQSASRLALKFCSLAMLGSCLNNYGADKKILAKVELNFEFLLDFYALFGAMGVPPLKLWRDRAVILETVQYSMLR